MSEARFSKTIRRNGPWLNGLMLLLSAILWLGVSSNRNNVLHAIGKLGVDTKGYGTVSLPLLLIGLLWSIGGCLLGAAIYAIDLKSKRSVYLCLGILALVVATGLLAVLFDYWFSISLSLALAVEVLEPAVAALIGWIAFIKPSGRNGLSGLVGSSLFGLFGLIFVTSICLLAFPRVSFRF